MPACDAISLRSARRRGDRWRSRVERRAGGTHSWQGTLRLSAAPASGFAYDATGNRLGEAGVDRSASGTHNQIQSDGTYSYQYDGEGNTTRRTAIATGLVREFTWDHRNRLVGVLDRGSASGPVLQEVRYLYDAFDRKVEKRLDGNGDGVFEAYTAWAYDGVHAALQFEDADGAGAA